VVDIFDIIDYVLADGRRFNPVWGADKCSAGLVLWLKRPGGSFKDGFVCYRHIIASGKEMAVANWLSNLTKREEEAKEQIFIASLPYIIDGCTDIANSPHGPWTNLIPGES
jgi:hypothetical protein